VLVAFSDQTETAKGHAGKGDLLGRYLEAMHGGGMDQNGSDISNFHAEGDGASTRLGAALTLVDQELAIEIAELDMADILLELAQGSALAAQRLAANILEIVEVKLDKRLERRAAAELGRFDRAAGIEGLIGVAGPLLGLCLQAEGA
jgi:hypothetical protein